MSYASNSSKSGGAASGEASRYVVPAQTIGSAVSSHQWQSGWTDNVPRRDELAELQTELHAATAAYLSGKMSGAELDLVQNRVEEATRAYDKRTADYRTRREAGQTKPGDFFTVFYGCTDEDAEECVRNDRYQADVQRANRARSGSRMTQQSRHGRGY